MKPLMEPIQLINFVIEIMKGDLNDYLLFKKGLEALKEGKLELPISIVHVLTKEDLGEGFKTGLKIELNLNPTYEGKFEKTENPPLDLKELGNKLKETVDKEILREYYGLLDEPGKN